jgi:beta-lactamase regulating signal transducer with metallopeptidase domain
MKIVLKHNLTWESVMKTLLQLVLSRNIAIYPANLAIAVTLICAAGLLSTTLLRKKSAVLRHAMLVSTLAFTLLLPGLVWLTSSNGMGLMQISIGRMSNAESPPATKGDISADNNRPGKTPSSFPADWRPGVSFPQKTARSHELLNSSAPPSNAAEAAASSAQNIVDSEDFEIRRPIFNIVTAAAVFVWLAGMLAGAVWQVRGFAVLRRFRRSLEKPDSISIGQAARETAVALGLRKIPAIMLSARAPAPLSLGLFHPLIVLPKNLAQEIDAAELRAVLIHETAHLAGRHHWIGLGQCMAEIVFWWNPLLRMVNRGIMRLREEICDDHVLQSRADGPDFAGVLVQLAAKIADMPKLPATIAIVETGLGDLGRRIARLLDTDRPITTRLNRKAMSIVLLFGLIIAALIPFAGLRAEQKLEEQKTENAALPEEKSKTTLDAIVDSSKDNTVQKSTDEPKSNQTIKVAGICLDENKRPIKDAELFLFLFSIQEPGLVQKARTDESGKFIFDPVPSISEQECGNKRFRLFARASGKATAMKEFPLPASFGPANPERIEFIMKKAASIRGRVTDKDGYPIAGVLVTSMPYLNRPIEGIWCAKTDADGNYDIKDSGEYDAATQRSLNKDPKVYVEKYPLYAFHPEFAGKCVMHNKSPDTVNFVLSPGAVIEGRVIDGNTGKSEAGIAVSLQVTQDFLMKNHASSFKLVKTGENGRYRFNSLEGGKYNIWATQKEKTVKAIDSFEAVPGKTLTAPDLKFIDGGFIEGRVVDADTGQSPQFKPEDCPDIAHYGPDRPRSGAACYADFIKPDGTFRIRAAPGLNFPYFRSRGPWETVSFSLMNNDNNREVTQEQNPPVIDVSEGQTVKLEFKVRKQKPSDQPHAGAYTAVAMEADSDKSSKLPRGIAEPADSKKRIEAALAVLQADPPAPQDKRIDAAIDILRVYSVHEGDERPWAFAIRQLIEIGPPAVPKLAEELDRTERNITLRALGFVLRGIGDPGAVPALIRAIPRLAQPSGSDCGITIENDPKLLKFMQEHDNRKIIASNFNGSENAESSYPGLEKEFMYGRPINEIMPALQKISNEKNGWIELAFTQLDKSPQQNRLKLMEFQKHAERWADWWSENWQKFVKDESQAQIEQTRQVLAKNAEELAKIPAKPLTEIPCGPDVEFTEGEDWPFIVAFDDSKHPMQQMAFFDLDTGRLPTPPPDLVKNSSGGRPSPELLAWAEKEGIDLIGIKFKPPGSEKSSYAFQPVGLKVWRIENSRYNNLAKILQISEYFDLPKPWQGPIASLDEKTGQIDEKKPASFLFITKQGICGMLRIQSKEKYVFPKEGTPSREIESPLEFKFIFRKDNNIINQ